MEKKILDQLLEDEFFKQHFESLKENEKKYILEVLRPFTENLDKVVGALTQKTHGKQ